MPGPGFLLVAEEPVMPASQARYRPETRLVHAGTLRSEFGETSEALFLTQGYVYESSAQAERRFKNEEPGYQYSRFANPTVAMFETRMAAFEGAEAARATATGMAAVTVALLGQLKAGDHVVAAKALFGSCRCVGGVILGSEKFIQDNVHNLIRQTGPSISPFNAWVLLKGLETLSVRVHRQTDTAATVSVALVDHPKVTRMIYPGRPDHPQAAIAQKQMRGGSTLVTFEVKGGKAGAFRFQDALKLIRISNNLGDAKSLITHPATTTHQRIGPAARAELGITDGMVRLSCGLEHPDDVCEDLLAALDKVEAVTSPLSAPR